MARVTGLEPATSGVTGRHSNQLSYTRVVWAGNYSFERSLSSALDSRNNISRTNLFSLGIAPRAYEKSRLNGGFFMFTFLGESGASDGARTRDLRRDRPAL